MSNAKIARAVLPIPDRVNVGLVTSDYTRKTSVFNGKVNWVQIDLGKDDHDHLISPDERLRLAMARQ